ncbi:MAG: response receiver sensor histidine kinase response regulator [Myxococcales bacterium]|nr:response receiver sensor histidine kinase response regulator [Myxococcales bacterium]
MGPLHILLVEESPLVAAQVSKELSAFGDSVECHRVADEAALRSELRNHRWDAVVGDWSMANANGVTALGVLDELGLDIPFVAVSGVAGEEGAVAAMRAGARDYVLKEKLWRLVPVLKRELSEAGRRAVHRETEAKLRAQDLRLRALVDEARLAQKALLLSEARFERLSASGIIGIALSAQSTAVIGEANDAYLRILGYSRDDLLTGELTTSRLISPEPAELTLALRAELRRTGALPPMERELMRKDGTRVWVLAGAALLEDGRALSFIVDLTARKAAEEALRKSEAQRGQAQKMEAIGGLAAGVAHDFNNLLSVILGHSLMLSRDLDPSNPIRAGLDEITAAGQSAANLTGQLLAFSRQQVLQPRIIDIGRVAGGMEKMLRRLVGEDIDLRVLGARDLGNALIDQGQLEQIVMNLVVNARDAMPSGGTLTIVTANVFLDDPYVASHDGARTGPQVMLAVSDTGSGMDAETQRRIFEPFFTTKDLGKGTGLGLTTVFGIVKQSFGAIAVHSELGVGTTIKIYFPRTDRQHDHVEAIAESAPLAPGGTETILLVEDDPRVRNVTRAMLRPLGYNVLDAQNGGDALLVCEQFGAKIDLLLTDVVMPRMSGRALAERLRLLQPGMKVIFVSGYADSAIVRHGVLDPEIPFLQKPLDPDALGRKVREVLDSPAT